MGGEAYTIESNPSDAFEILFTSISIIKFWKCCITMEIDV